MIVNNLYTVIMEYAGGTYISQVHALSWESAMQEWWWQMDWGGLAPPIDPHEALEEIKEEELVLLRNVESVWFGHFLFSGKESYGNVVLTVRHC